MELLKGWVGRSRALDCTVTEAPVAALSATLDYAHSRALLGEPLPACWHWIYFQEAVATAGLGVDGHPRRGDFLPPVPLSRRMWAGSRLQFFAPVKVGETLQRISTIADIQHKAGRNGELVFVTVNHRIFQSDRLAIEEDQDLVYRGPAARAKARAAQSDLPQAQWSAQLCPDAILLFRYSALTFNSHRIHFDRDYAMREEGYDSLVVQGPLTATLLLDLLHRQVPGAELSRFEFRAKRPLLEGSRLQLQGNRQGHEVHLWALDAAGALAMDAHATLR
jgi:3-methylfumaryl-CoA hydratase